MQYVHGGVFRCYYHHHYHHHVTTMAKMRKQKWKQKIHLFWPYYPSKSKKILFTHQPSKPNQTSIGWIFSSSSSCFWYFFFCFWWFFLSSTTHINHSWYMCCWMGMDIIIFVLFEWWWWWWWYILCVLCVFWYVSSKIKISIKPNTFIMSEWMNEWKNDMHQTQKGS